MTKKRLISVLALAAIVVAVWQFWPSDERRIRKRLDVLVSVLNERPAEGVPAVARTARLASFFQESVVVEPGEGREPIRGRDRLLAFATRMHRPDERVTVAVENLRISVAGDSATAALTALLTWVPLDAGEPSVDARPVELTWIRSDDWRISAVRLPPPQ